jgi:hypothetical protein
VFSSIEPSGDIAEHAADPIWLRRIQGNTLTFKIWIRISSDKLLKPSMGIKALSDDFFWHVTCRDGARLSIMPEL